MKIGNNSDTASIFGGTKRDVARRLQENQTAMLKEAHNRASEQAREQRRQQQRPRRTGSVRLSNTDSLRRAFQVRSRLTAKLMEVQGSDMAQRARGAAAMDVKLMIDRVDRQIAAIRRRERAIQEERTTRRRDDTPEARRRRARDIQERSVFVRRALLYHANNGGFDPNNPLFLTGAQNPTSSVAFDIGGSVGTMEIAADADFSTDFNMEVVL